MQTHQLKKGICQNQKIKQFSILVLGLFEDSLEIYEKVLSIKSNHFFALWGKSESLNIFKKLTILRGQRKFSESLIWYDKVLEQRSIYPYAYHYKGYALQLYYY